MSERVRKARRGEFKSSSKESKAKASIISYHLISLALDLNSDFGYGSIPPPPIVEQVLNAVE